MVAHSPGNVESEMRSPSKRVEKSLPALTQHALRKFDALQGNVPNSMLTDNLGEEDPSTARRRSLRIAQSPRVSQLHFSDMQLGSSPEKEKSPVKEMMTANYSCKKATKK